MFYLGAALHLVQDMCVPHHSLGIIFDGHKEFETTPNLCYLIVRQKKKLHHTYMMQLLVRNLFIYPTLTMQSNSY